MKNKQGNMVSRKERIEQLKVHIREIGLWNLPTHENLGIKYGVSRVQITKDISKIISQFAPHELDEIFTEFINADKKAQRELRKIIHMGTDDEKMKAIDVMNRLQKGTTDLLEAYSKKQKIADKIQHEVKQVVINIHKPVKTKERVYDIKPIKDKLENDEDEIVDV